MEQRTDCESRHVYGSPRKVGGGILRSVCLACGTVRLGQADVAVGMAKLFQSVQRHLLFSPLVEYAALYGHELLEPPGFGRRRGRLAEARARA